MKNLTYKKLLIKLLEADFKNTCLKSIQVYPNIYFMVNTRYRSFHVTIFINQWDDYIDKKYSLIHITKQNVCSKYFRVNKKLDIEEIPKFLFKYEQDEFSMKTSTRKKCTDKIIKKIIKDFEKVLKKTFKKKN